MNNWQTLKQQGSEHYKSSGGIEPIDLYKEGGLFHDYAITSIIKYAYRNRKAFKGPYISKEDMAKIRHLTELLEVLYESN